jgi:hypothetical protein
METNLLRKGIWQPSDSIQLALPLETDDILGHLYINRPLRMLDLDTMAWLVQRFRELRDAGQLTDDGAVPFTLYELGQDFYLRAPGGKERRMLRQSLFRLTDVAVTLVGYDAIRHLADEEICARAHLLEVLQWRRELRGPPCKYDPKDTGAVRANAFEARIASWLVAQIDARNITYLDWRILRELDGMAKRLWVYLEAQRFKRINGLAAQAYIILGERAYASLGIHETRAYRARGSLARAGTRICEVDRSYDSIVVDRAPIGRTNWRVMATRLTAEGRRFRDAGGDPVHPLPR